MENKKSTFKKDFSIDISLNSISLNEFGINVGKWNNYVYPSNVAIGITNEEHNIWLKTNKSIDHQEPKLSV